MRDLPGDCPHVAGGALTVRYLLLGLLVFLICIIAFAPAGIIERGVDTLPGVEMTDPRGTLWRGQGRLSAPVQSGGQIDAAVTWDLNLLSLVSLSPTYQWTLQNPNFNLRGTAGTSFDGHLASVEGTSDAVPLNEWLQVYHIVLSGDFAISPTRMLVSNSGMLTDIEGRIEWSGGKVRYTLSGILHEVDLPPLEAFLERNDNDQPQATVFEKGGSTPLLIASLSENGFARVAMTKLFTKLLRTPWPGSDPDHAVVLEVEEQVL